MARQAAKEKALQRLYLFYSNRRPEDAAFLDLLAALRADKSQFQFHCHDDSDGEIKKEMDRRDGQYRSGHVVASCPRVHRPDFLPCGSS
jgi:ferredoxin-NADP reductase